MLNETKQPESEAPVERFLISFNVPVRVRDLHRRVEPRVLPKGARCEALLMKTWLVFPEFGWRGLPTEEWLACWGDEKIEIERFNGDAWEKFDGTF